MRLLQDLAIENQTKILLLVVDGLGGLPDEGGLTELERAYTPHLDELASRGQTGFLEMVDCGITPGSGPGHLALFGYDPLEYFIGRGVLEALGLGLEIHAKEVCVRGNFCTFGEHDFVIDRRAGRLSTEKCRQLVERLNSKIKEIEGVSVAFYPSEGHRFVVVFSGEGLDENVSDADPLREGRPMVWARPKKDAAWRMASVANALIAEVRGCLSGEEEANGCLLRGFSSLRPFPTLRELYRINPAAVAAYPMYRGLAQLVGMDLLDAGFDWKGIAETVSAYWDAYDFFFVHIKQTDLFGEDGDFEGKRRAIEIVDRLVARLMAQSPDVFAVTGDHSTPSTLRGHSWHPVPCLISSPYVRPDDSLSFGERMCAAGSLGTLPASKLMGLLLAHASRLSAYGA